MHNRPTPFLALLALAALSGLAMAEDAPEPAARVRYRTPPTAQQCCGIDSLYVSLRAAGRVDVPLSVLEKELPLGPRGVSVEAIQASCQTHHVALTVVRTDLAMLRDCVNPVILHVNGDHFISFLGMKEGRLLIFDSTVGLFDCSPEWFSAYYKWDGVALIVGPPPPAVALALYGPSVAAIAFALGCLWMFVRLCRQQRAVPEVAV